MIFRGKRNGNQYYLAEFKEGTIEKLTGTDWGVIIRILNSLMGDQDNFTVPQLKYSIPLPPSPSDK